MSTTAYPSKTIELVIQEQKFNVQFPNTGQFIDIQALKGKVASDNYNHLSNSNDQYTGYAMLMADMIATFNVLIPTLKEKLNVTSILSLSMVESNVLLNAYINQWIPFFQSWMDIITAPISKENDAKQTAS